MLVINWFAPTARSLTVSATLRTGYNESVGKRAAAAVPFPIGADARSPLVEQATANENGLNMTISTAVRRRTCSQLPRQKLANASASSSWMLNI